VRIKRVITSYTQWHINNRVTICLENLEMSGNLIAVREMNVREFGKSLVPHKIFSLTISGNVRNCQGKNPVRGNVSQNVKNAVMLNNASD